MVKIATPREWLDKKITITKDGLLIDGDPIEMFIAEDITVRTVFAGNHAEKPLYAVEVSLYTQDAEVIRDGFTARQHERVVEVNDAPDFEGA